MSNENPTKKQVSSYLAHKARRCLFCGSAFLAALGVKFSAKDDSASEEVHCLLCNRKWCDHLTVTSVTPL